MKKRMRLLLLTLSFFCVVLDAKANITPDIVGGVTVSEGDPVAMSTVFLVGRESQGSYSCTASILSPDTLVTAAHCVVSRPEDIQIVFALNANYGGGQTLGITGYAVYPGYQGENASGADIGDIAVVHLAGEIPPGYRPATLLPDGVQLGSGMSTLLAGYGITDGYTDSGAGILRKVVALIGGTYGSTEVLINQSNHHGSCNGDSGGPAFQVHNGQLYLWGVTSRGDRYCVREGIYTRINAYESWINNSARLLRERNH